MEKFDNNLEWKAEEGITREKTKPATFYENLEKERKAGENDSEKIAGIRAALKIIEANPQTSLRQSYKDGLEKGYSLEELEKLKEQIPGENLLEEAVKEKIALEQKNTPSKKSKTRIGQLLTMLGL